MNIPIIEYCEIQYLGRDKYFGQMWSIDFTLKNDKQLYRTDVALNSKNIFSIGNIRGASNIERDHLLEQFVFLIKKYSKQRVKMIVSTTNLIRISGEDFIPLKQYKRFSSLPSSFSLR